MVDEVLSPRSFPPAANLLKGDERSERCPFGPFPSPFFPPPCMSAWEIWELHGHYPECQGLMVMEVNGGVMMDNLWAALVWQDLHPHNEFSQGLLFSADA